MKLHIDSADLQALIAEMLEHGLKRDRWLPATAVPTCSAEIAELRKRFAQERANNIVSVVMNEQALDEESEAA